MADGRSNIAIKLEMYDGKCATTLSLRSDSNGTWRIAIADSWFGSVKTVIVLKESSLYSVKLVKTAHRQFPQ